MSDIIQGIYKLFTRDSEADLTDDAVNGIQQRELGFNRSRQWLSFLDTDDTLKRFGIIFHYDSRSFTSFANAITTLGAENCTLVVAQQEAVSTDVTVPSNIHVMVVGAGSFDVSAGNTLTINGQLTAPFRKIFFGDGTAALGATANDQYIQQWWEGDRDSYIQIGQTKVSNSRYYSIGIDESDSSKLKVSYGATGAAPGTNDYLSVSTAGAVHVYNNATVAGTLGVTGATTLAALSATTGSFSSTLGVTGLITATAGISFPTSSSGGVGRIFKTDAGGLIINGITGSSYDLSIRNAAQDNLIQNPTGTSILEFPRAGGISVTGPMTLTTNPVFSWLSANKIPFSSNDGSFNLTSSSLFTYNSSTQVLAAPNASFSGTLGVTGTSTLGTVNASGNITIANSGNPALIINATSVNNRLISFQTNGTARWAWIVDNTAESGSDAGSKIFLRAFTDAGATIDSPIDIVRVSGGAMTLSRPITSSAGIALTGGAGGVGTLAKSSTQGLQLVGVTGSTNDFVVRSAANTTVMRVPTGTSTVDFPVDTTMSSTFNVTGLQTNAGNIRFSSSDPEINKSNNTGRVIITSGTGNNGALGAVIRLEGADYGGVGSGGNAQLTAPSTSKLFTISMAISVAGNATFSGSTGFTGQVDFTARTKWVTNASGDVGAIWKSSGSGLVMEGVTGSSYDLAFLNPSAQPLLRNPTGTQTMEFAGIVNATSRLNVGGATDNSSWALNVSGGALGVSGSNGIYSYGFGVPGDANYERAGVIHTGTAAEFRSMAGGTGTAEPLALVVGGTTRYSIDNNGFHTVTGGSFAFSIDDNTTEAWVIKQGSNEYFEIKTSNSAEQITFGNTSTNPIVRILGGSGATAGLRLQTNETDATNKEGRLKAGHYTNSEEPTTMMWTSNTSSLNNLYIGGNSSAENAVTSIEFYTAANNTTTTGTYRGGFGSSGVFTVVGNQTVGGTFAVQTDKFTVDGSGNSSFLGRVGMGTAAPSSTALDIKTSISSGSTQYGIVDEATFSSSATTNMKALYVRVISAAASYTTTNVYGIQIDTPSKGSGHTMSTVYGLKIEAQNQGSTNYAIYTDGGDVRFGDRVTMTSSLALTSTSAYMAIGQSASSDVGLYISESLTGLTSSDQKGLISRASFNSSATGAGTAGYFQVRTANSSFTMTNGYAVRIPDANKGASSTITNLYGLKVEDQTAGGTNYAIYTGLGTVRIGGQTTIVDTATIGSGSVSTDKILSVDGFTTSYAGATKYGISSTPSFTGSTGGSAFAIYSKVTKPDSSGSTTNAWGLYVDTPSIGSGASITTSIGIGVANMTGGGTNYAIYTNSGTVRFGGALTLDGGMNTVSGGWYDSGTYTATATGMSSSTTGTARWTKVGNHVTLYIPQLTNTSNSTSLTITGMPAAIRPARTQIIHGMPIRDNSTSYALGVAQIATDGTMTLGFCTSVTSGYGFTFTSSGGKGWDSVTTITYALD